MPESGSSVKRCSIGSHDVDSASGEDAKHKGMIGRSTTADRVGSIIAMLAMTILTLYPAVAQVSDSDQKIVDSFFPQKLIDDAARDEAAGGYPLVKFSAFATADLDRTGRQDFIVAAYSNGFLGAVRLLKRVPSGAVLVDEPDQPMMGGVFPAVRMIDLDGDGISEAIVSFSPPGSATGFAAEWIFKWIPPKLVFMGPPADDPQPDAEEWWSRQRK